jgi:hypothetical protein
MAGYCCYYLTADPLAAFEGRLQSDEARAARARVRPENLKGEGMVFADPAEVLLAFAQKKVGIPARIGVRLPLDKRVITEVRAEKDKARLEELDRRPDPDTGKKAVYLVPTARRACGSLPAPTGSTPGSRPHPGHAPGGHVLGH